MRPRPEHSRLVFSFMLFDALDTRRQEAPSERKAKEIAVSWHIFSIKTGGLHFTREGSKHISTHQDPTSVPPFKLMRSNNWAPLKGVFKSFILLSCCFFGRSSRILTCCFVLYFTCLTLMRLIRNDKKARLSERPGGSSSPGTFFQFVLLPPDIFRSVYFFPQFHAGPKKQMNS